MAESPFHIRPAQSRDDIDAIRAMVSTYAASLGVDLSFQGFAAELADLAGHYAPPAGALLIARDPGDEPLGCVALQALPQAGCCEMKRLYVAPAGRGHGLGRALAEEIIRLAREAGYRDMRLDTLPPMAPAIALYRALGFVPIPPYYATPLADTLFFSLKL